MIFSLIISILSKIYAQDNSQTSEIFFVPKSDSPSGSAFSSMSSKLPRSISENSSQSKDKSSQLNTTSESMNSWKNLSYVLPIIDKYLPINIGKKTYVNLIKFINTSVQNKDFFDEILFGIQYKRITFVDQELRATMMNDFVSLCKSSESFLNKILEFALLPVYIFKLQDYLQKAGKIFSMTFIFIINIV